MKKRISVLAAVVLAVGFALFLAACGETKDDTVTVGAERVFVDSGAVFREFQKFFPVLSPE